MTRIGKRTELCQLQGERTDNGGDYQGIMTIDRKLGGKSEMVFTKTDGISFESVNAIP